MDSTFPCFPTVSHSPEDVSPFLDKLEDVELVFGFSCSGEFRAEAEAELLDADSVSDCWYSEAEEEELCSVTMSVPFGLIKLRISKKCSNAVFSHTL